MTDFLQAHPNGQVIAADEMSLYFQATLTRVWAPIGQTPQVWVSPERAHVHFYGAVNVRTGHELAIPVHELSSATSADFVRQIVLCYPGQPLLLFWDRAGWHKGAAVRAALAEYPQVEVLYFPPACPALNPQEHVWSQARAAVSHNHTFRVFSTLRQAFLQYLSNTLFPLTWLAKYAPPVLYEV